MNDAKTRTPSKHTVIVFNPNNDGTLGDVLKEAQAKDPSVVAISANGKFGLVQTPEGYFFVDEDGVGSEKPVKSVVIEFYRHFKDNGGTSFEVIPFGKATFRLEECLALEIARVPLHEFVRTFGSRLEYNYEQMERRLSEATVASGTD